MTLADRTTIEVISQQYNKLHEIHNKNKASERVDTRFNAHYELLHVHKYVGDFDSCVTHVR